MSQVDPDVNSTDVEKNLHAFLSHLQDPCHRERTLAFWNEIKQNLSNKQRVAFLRAWNRYFVKSDIGVFDQVVDDVVAVRSGK